MTKTHKHNAYETDFNMGLYCEFHYGDEYFAIPNFPKKYAEYALEKMQNQAKVNALEIGCAVGRASFELAHEFSQVTGVDFSARFIQTANELKEGKTLRYAVQDEGDISQFKEISLKALGLDAVTQRCCFTRQDACNLDSIFQGYDLILAANLIDRLYQPGKFLNDIHNRLNESGLLILSSPYTWLEEFTEKQYWIGGYRQDGENVTTLDGLKSILLKHFELIDVTDLPFVIRETKRKFQHSIAEVSAWQKK